MIFVMLPLLLWSTKGTTKGVHSGDDDDDVDDEDDDDDLEDLPLPPIIDLEPHRRRFIKNGRCGSKCWLPPNHAAPKALILLLLIPLLLLLLALLWVSLSL